MRAVTSKQLLDTLSNGGYVEEFAIKHKLYLHDKQGLLIGAVRINTFINLDISCETNHQHTWNSIRYYR